MKPWRRFYRCLRPYLDIKGLALALWSSPWYVRQLVRYRAATRESVPLSELYPALKDRFAPAGNIDPHYFNQDLWVAGRIITARPPLHVDVGSRLDGFVAPLSLVVPVEYVDLRPIDIVIPTLRYRQGSIYALPYADASIISLSSLHVVEHIGLGRYGDALDPEGPAKALRELKRVLAPGGVLYVSVPIGRPRVCFNSHRVFSPDFILAHLDGLQLMSFSGVTDEGKFRMNCSPQCYQDCDYALGIYEFKRIVGAPKWLDVP